MNQKKYPPPLDRLLQLGSPEDLDSFDYLSLGLSEQHIPSLIEILEVYQELRFSDLNQESDDPALWAPVHAWRALGELKAESAIPALIRQLHQIDDHDDEWFMEEAPKVFEQIGPASIEPLGEYLSDSNNLLFPRVTASVSLVQLGQAYPESKERCKELLVQTLKSYADNDETINAFVIDSLIKLDAAETAPLVEKVFEEDKVDQLVFGDFEDFQIKLGLIEPPPPSERKAGYFPSFPAFPGPRSVRQDSKKEKSKRKQAQKSRRKNRKK